MRQVLALVAVVSLLGAGARGQSLDAAGVRLPDAAPGVAAYADGVAGRVSPERLRAMHGTLAAEPHVAGSAGDARVIAEIASYFEGLGLEVEVHRFWAYLPEPVTAHAELVAPARRTLAVRETPKDEWMREGGVSPGWNAYSGTGDVTAPVVYVNRGTKADFETLEELGVSVKGKIAVARYGGNFRGYKAKFAEEAGAVGLMIYTDPADAGYAKGPAYPEGGWYDGTSVQRGSILTLDYPGDPLTPGVEATREAPRLDPSEVDFPTIPVQPVGWDAAREVLSRLDGPAVPDESWQGALPFTYRLTGEDVRLRLVVAQRRRLVETANVIGTLRGAEAPGQVVLIGSHHDAWGHGAHDPLSGTIATLECARVFAEAARDGDQPARSVAFACWGAEEHGIVGSTEWVEANEARLTAGAAAYFNLDAAASGLNLGASASPTLKDVIAWAASRAGSPKEGAGSALEAWRSRAEAGEGELPPFGDLGGGSDHVGLYCRAGVPSAGIGARGSSGSGYHSGHDTLGWYRSVVGEDYASAALVARVTALAAARVADGGVLPLELSRYGQDVVRHVRDLGARAEELGMELDLQELLEAGSEFEERARVTMEYVRAAAAGGRLDGAALASVNALLLSFERLWLDPGGLPGRPWFRNLFAATDPTSGYAAWMLPEVRHYVEAGDAAGAAAAARRLESSLSLMTEALRSLRALTPPEQED